MRSSVLVLLAFAASAPAATPPVICIPRFDAEGFPLPASAVRRLGSAAFRVGSVNDLVFSPNCDEVYVGRSMAGTLTGGVLAVDTATGRPRWHAVSSLYVHRLALSGDGRTVWAIGYRYENRTPTVEVVGLRADGGEVVHRRKVNDRLAGTLLLASTGRAAVFTPQGVSVTDPGADEPVFKSTAGTKGYTGDLLSADGKWLVLSGQLSDDKPFGVRVYNVTAGKEAWTADVGGYAQVQLHPDGKRLWALTPDPSGMGGFVFRAWDLATGEAAAPQEMPGSALLPVTNPQFLPGGRTAVGIVNGGVVEVELPKWKVKRSLPEVPAFSRFWVSEDGSTLATADGTTLALFSTATGKLTAGRVSNLEGVLGVRFEKGRAALQRYTETVTYDLATGREVERARAPVGRAQAGEAVVARSADRRTEVIAGPGKLSVRRADQPDRVTALADSADYGGRSLSVTADGARVVAGLSNGGAARVWDATTGKKQFDLENGTPPGATAYPVSAVKCSPDGGRVAVHEFNFMNEAGGNVWVVGVWDLTTGKLVRRVQGNGSTYAQSFGWSPDGRALAIHGNALTPGRKPGFVTVCDATSDAAPRTVETDQTPTAVAVTGDGKRVAVATYWAVDIVDAAGAARPTALRVSGVLGLAFTPDGKQLVSDGREGTFLHAVPDLRVVPVAPRPRPAE